MNILKNKKAFSLIELSIVLLIIGIIIAGVTQSSRMIKQFKLSSARSQTQSSAAASISDMIVWYDATTERSFDAAESEDAELTTTDIHISTWYDLNSTNGTKNNATQATTGAKPLYFASCINGLPCVRFDGGDFLTFNGNNLVGNDYTIFVVEQRRAATGFFIGTSEESSNNTSMFFGYGETNRVDFGNGNTSSFYSVGTSPAIANFSTVYPSNLKLHTFANGSVSLANVAGVEFFYHYLNGSDTASTKAGSPTMSTISSYNAPAIGVNNATEFFTGDIGEIIMYSRFLKTEERIAVENYLLKKWGINSL